MASIRCNFKSLCNDLPVYNISSEEEDLDCFSAISTNHNTDGGVIPLLAEESEIAACNTIYESCESQAQANALAEEAFIECVSGLAEDPVVEITSVVGTVVTFTVLQPPPLAGVILMAHENAIPDGSTPPDTEAKVNLWNWLISLELSTLSIGGGVYEVDFGAELGLTPESYVFRLALTEPVFDYDGSEYYADWPDLVIVP